MLNDVGLLLFRLTFGLTMLIAHGMPKLLNFQTKMNVFPDPLGIGSSLSLGLTIGSEVVCALLLTLGLFTRIVSAPLVITMLVAAFVVHGNDPWKGKELAFIYMMGYLAMMFVGPGKFSIDHFWRKKS